MFAALAMVTWATGAPSHAAGTGTLTTLYIFGTSMTDGANPRTGLIIGSDGNFYGVTGLEGMSDFGTAFRLTPAGAFTTVYSFGQNRQDGTTYKTIIEGADLDFYGTTADGGQNGSGSIFRLTPSGTFSTLYSFGSAAGEGANPQAGLVEDGNHDFFGTTALGGAHSVGTLFRLSNNGNFTAMHSFGSTANDGTNPVGSLIQASDGSIYGVTSRGGLYNYGTIFRLTSLGAVNVVYSFGSHISDGNDPLAGLIEGSDHNLYGTTNSGGAYDSGTCYKMTLGGAFTTLCSFGGAKNDGKQLLSSLLQASDGNFYGTSARGGDHDAGALYRITSDGTLTTLYSFGSLPTDGQTPECALVETTDGSLYGTTRSAGAYSAGTVFKFSCGLPRMSSAATPH